MSEHGEAEYDEHRDYFDREEGAREGMSRLQDVDHDLEVSDLHDGWSTMGMTSDRQVCDAREGVRYDEQHIQALHLIHLQEITYSVDGRCHDRCGWLSVCFVLRIGGIHTNSRQGGLVDYCGWVHCVIAIEFPLPFTVVYCMKFIECQHTTTEQAHPNARKVGSEGRYISGRQMKPIDEGDEGDMREYFNLSTVTKFALCTYSLYL